jgi:primosomal protein N' (replication factor Y)
MKGYCEIIVDIATAQVDRLFTYAVPSGMTLSPGTRVLVPFGHRSIEGIVLELKDEAGMDESRVRPVTRALDEYPAILPPLVEMAREMAQKAHCPLAATLRLMLPAQMRGGRVKEKTQKAARLLVTGEELDKARENQSRSPKRRLLLDLLADGDIHPVSDLKVLVRDPLPALKVLEEQGALEVIDQQVLRSPFRGPAVMEKDPPPTPGQQEALSEILPAIGAGRGSFLLHGVTGSGKTEVYIQAVRRCLKMGKSAIVLVPEIVLTPQIVSWFRGRFGDVAAVLHSRLSAGEKYDEWRRIRAGQARVVIGARSAIFAPVQNPGIFIVDEEHEQSYFSEHAPSYDARDVAQSRAQREGAVLLLASATPSILSFARAEKGEYMLLEMLSRVNNRPLPQVTVVDMREELRLGNKGMFSYALLDSLDRCVKSGQQAMLFVNRRGYSSSVVCRKCGYALQCGQCDIAYTWHQADRKLHCHYCGAREDMPPSCPQCGGKYLKTVGVGTQRVEEEIKKLYPDIGTVRMDFDNTQGKDAHRQLLARFRSGEARIMVGTQMIAKGLDFPQVTLVGAVLADISVNMPDYRAAERTFQLLTQVAGRAGRADMPGEVIIQSYKPEHYAIAAAATQDYRNFFATEFARRRRDLYPPFTLLVRLLCQAPNEQVARDVSGQLFENIKQTLQQNPLWKKRVLFYREDDAPIKRLMGYSRAQVLLKMIDHKDSHALIEYLNELAGRQWPCPVYLEINPASLA